MAAKIAKTCPECGNRFPQNHHRQQFCIPAHGRAYNNRIIGEGQSVMGLAKAWRAGGSRMRKDPRLNAASKEAFILLCRAIDASNAADVAAGRMNAAQLFVNRQVNNLLD